MRMYWPLEPEAAWLLPPPPQVFPSREEAEAVFPIHDLSDLFHTPNTAES